MNNEKLDKIIELLSEILSTVKEVKVNTDEPTTDMTMVNQVKGYLGLDGD